MEGHFEFIGAVFATLAVLGSVQAAVGTCFLIRFSAGRAPALSSRLPAVTVMKPLYGAHPLLEEALRGFCQQDYPDLQLIFGVQSANDPAIAIVDRLRMAFPARDIALVVDDTAHGINGKVANLINMLPHARHDVLIFSDSDMHVGPDYVAQVATSLMSEGVGLVTALYYGLPAVPTLLQRFGAWQISHSFLTGVLVARSLGRQDCLGGTIALTRQTLERAGGLESFADQVADDARLGERVRQLGLSVSLAPILTATTVAERGWRELLNHELRWGRVVRSVAGIQYALSALQYPLLWAMLSVIFTDGAYWALAELLVFWVWRWSFVKLNDRCLKVRTDLPFLMFPLRDILSIVVLILSYFSDTVEWNGRRLSVRTNLSGAGGSHQFDPHYSPSR